MTVALLDRRRIEAETFSVLYRELCRSQNERFALETIGRTVAALAYQAGRSFALQSPHGPSLEHFATVVDLWTGSGALSVSDLERSEKSLSLLVQHCAYAELYRGLGLPQPLIPLLSCARDAPFARGYSPRLNFQRTQTIAEGADCCDFLFTWD